MTKPVKDFDYMITGAGCAGLSLAMHMIHSGKFHDRKILLVDKDSKTSDDRTWCYWKSGADIFNSIVYRQWNTIWFHDENFSRQMNISPYQYKMIRGIDFYTYCFEEIRKHSNFTIVKDKVDRVFSNDSSTGAVVGGDTILADFVFNSIFFEQPVLKEKEYWLLQHFKGWIIQTDQQCFDITSAVLMDFRVRQEHGTAFCYLLPLSENEALVEYTLFSESLLSEENYANGLHSYIKTVLKINSFKIVGTESGVIPMTSHNFHSRQNNIINIGSAGGQTKGSTGYTFNFIQKHSMQLVHQLLNSGHPFISKRGKRFLIYDAILLGVLRQNAVAGEKVFSELFRKNDPLRILRFLDNETQFGEELRLISTLPKRPFLKEAIKQCINYRTH
ncbi:MAG: lycopene cyclase family protein [Flavisolibacter sp.]